MIDTIVIRLHNLKKYSTLVHWLNLTNSKGTKLETAVIDPLEIEKFRKIGQSPQQIFNSIKFNRTGDFLVRSQNIKKTSKSSHSEFIYNVDPTNDYINMNFSIPKYKYGTNVLMYLEHCNDRDYKYYENSLLEYNIKKAPGFLFSFIKYFFKNEFILFDIDYRDVEINRIDFCFNQVFDTREDALYHLKYQRLIRKKHSREEGEIEYATSFMYATKRHSFKIYHKGSEYEKNDRKHHQRFNDEQRDQIFNIDYIQELADKTLRYEVTLRNAALNYLFKHNLFRTNCPFFKTDFAIYKKVGNVMKRNERRSKEAGHLPKQERESYLRLNPYELISKEDKQSYKYVSQLIERSPKFMIEVSPESQLYSDKTILENLICKTALFSKELIYLGLKMLYSFINNFQLKELPDEERISILIDNYNFYHKPKLPKADMLQFYVLLVKAGSFKEANKLSRYSHATLYRYIDRFKKIGISASYVKPDDNIPFPKASVNLKPYHEFLRTKKVLKQHKSIIYEL